MGAQETIIYRLVMRNLSYAYFSFLSFWTSLAGKWELATPRAPNGLGLPVLTKKLSHWVDLVGFPLSRNHVLEMFRGEIPSLKWSQDKGCYTEPETFSKILPSIIGTNDI